MFLLSIGNVSQDQACPLRYFLLAKIFAYSASTSSTSVATPGSRPICDLSGFVESEAVA
jgi:hypothetical protein